MSQTIPSNQSVSDSASSLSPLAQTGEFMQQTTPVHNGLQSPSSQSHSTRAKISTQNQIRSKPIPIIYRPLPPDRDLWGTIDGFIPKEPETEEQAMIRQAWYSAHTLASYLQDYTQAFERRGIYNEETVHWYMHDAPEIGNLLENAKICERLGEKFKKLHAAIKFAHEASNNSNESGKPELEEVVPERVEDVEMDLHG